MTKHNWTEYYFEAENVRVFIQEADYFRFSGMIHATWCDDICEIGMRYYNNFHKFEENLNSLGIDVAIIA